MVSLLNGISTFVGYSMLKPSFQKCNCGTIKLIAGGIREFKLVLGVVL